MQVGITALRKMERFSLKRGKEHWIKLRQVLGWTSLVAWMIKLKGQEAQFFMQFWDINWLLPLTRICC